MTPLCRGRAIIGKGGARHEDGARPGQVQWRYRRHRTRRIAIGYDQPAPCDGGERTLPACSPDAVEHDIDTPAARALPHPAGHLIERAGGHPLDLERAHRIGLCSSEEHTSELQSLMRISYAVFCLTTTQKPHPHI